MFKSDEGPMLTEGPARRRVVGQPTAIVTPILIAINVLIFVAMVLAGFSVTEPTNEELFRWGANYGPATLGGQWWRLFTACFLHGGIIHLAFNMYVLYQVGMTTEILYGRARYLLIYIMSGVLGNVVSLGVHQNEVGVGASGAIFGVYGAFLGFLWIRRNVIPKQAMDEMKKSAAIFLGINLVFGLMNAGTDLSAHIGGLIVGLVLGCYLTAGRTSSVGR